MTLRANITVFHSLGARFDENISGPFARHGAVLIVENNLLVDNNLPKFQRPGSFLLGARTLQTQPHLRRFGKDLGVPAPVRPCGRLPSARDHSLSIAQAQNIPEAFV